MKLRPGMSLDVSLAFNEEEPVEACRLAMANGVGQLEWSPSVISRGLRVSPLAYPPEPGLHGARSRHFEGLHSFLHDSLPEGWGYLLMRKRLAKLGVRIEELGPADRLALVGHEGRGALVFDPSTTPDEKVGEIDLDSLAAEARVILSGEDGDLADVLAKLGGASGGARPKVHVGYDQQGGVVVSASETPGHEAWIVKFRSPADPADIGPIEEAYAMMAQAAGLTLSPHRLFPARDGPGYFGARRFDRPSAGRRLHMVSLCGALEAPAETPSVSYDGFFRATLAITRHMDDVRAAFRRMVFNVLACNRDDHTRQHSYLMDEVGDWRLAPAYDLTWSTGPGGEHYMDIEGEGRNPTHAHVAALGLRHGFRERETDAVLEEVGEAIVRWPEFANEAGVTRDSRTRIAAAHAQVREGFRAA